MRRGLVLSSLVLVLALPASVFALSFNKDDGTLSVKRGRGLVALNITGAILGRLDRGRIVAYDPDVTDGSGAVLRGCDRYQDLSDTTRNPNDTKEVCAGTKIRFRLIGGKYALRIVGSGIFLSAVGQGDVTLTGSDGFYSFNDEPYQDFPDTPVQFVLGAPSG